MDVFSHGLWTWLAAKFANLKLNVRLNTRLTLLFGVLPDIFSFAPLFIWLFFNLISNSLGLANFPDLINMEPAAHDTLFIFKATSLLYSITHSLVVFIIIFMAILLARHKPFLPLLGWLFHIIIDIPTHSYKFYPTPFLWPLSSWKFDGISWGNKCFMLANYSLIIIAYLLIRRIKK